MRYEYLVGQVQDGRVTFVNGKWAGKKDPYTMASNEALESCLSEWEFLNDHGKEGWELCGTATFVYQDKAASGVAPMPVTSAQRLYLKRVMP